MAKDKDRNISLRANYEKLRAAGFTSKDATRLRGASPDKINAAIERKTLPPVDPFRQAAGAGKKKETVKREQIRRYEREIKTWTKAKEKHLPPGYTELTGPIVYENATNHPVIKYLSNYSYVVAYQVKHMTGETEWKTLTFTSERKLYKYELYQEIDNEIFSNPENLGRYNSQVIRSSYTLVGAYEKR